MNASLRLIGDALDPDAVSSALGLTPSSSGRTGDPIIAELPGGRSVSRPAAAGYWVLELPATTPEALQSSLAAVLSKQPTPGIWRRLDLHVEVTVHEAPVGATAADLLSKETVHSLEAFGIDIAINDD